MIRTDDVRGWWQARDARERRMLWWMLAALSAFAWWYGVLAPLHHARDAAHAAHQRAAGTLATARAGEALLSAQAGGDARRPSTTEALSAAVEETARSAGVAISRGREGEPGEWVLEIDAVDYDGLVAWLDALRQRHRLAPDALHATTEHGRLRVQARFRMPAGQAIPR